MDEKEFRNFQQKQRDSEDESRQQEERGEKSEWRKLLRKFKREAGEKGMTWEEYIAWIESFQGSKGLVAHVKFLRQLEERSK